MLILSNIISFLAPVLEITRPLVFVVTGVVLSDLLLGHLRLLDTSAFISAVRVPVRVPAALVVGVCRSAVPGTAVFFIHLHHISILPSSHVHVQEKD